MQQGGWSWRIAPLTPFELVDPIRWGEAGTIQALSPHLASSRTARRPIESDQWLPIPVFVEVDRTASGWLFRRRFRAWHLQRSRASAATGSVTSTENPASGETANVKAPTPSIFRFVMEAASRPLTPPIAIARRIFDSWTSPRGAGSMSSASRPAALVVSSGRPVGARGLRPRKRLRKCEQVIEITDGMQQVLSGVLTCGGSPSHLIQRNRPG